MLLYEQMEIVVTVGQRVKLIVLRHDKDIDDCYEVVIDDEVVDTLCGNIAEVIKMLNEFLEELEAKELDKLDQLL